MQLRPASSSALVTRDRRIHVGVELADDLRKPIRNELRRQPIRVSVRHLSVQTLGSSCLTPCFFGAHRRRIIAYIRVYRASRHAVLTLLRCAGISDAVASVLSVISAAMARSLRCTGSIRAFPVALPGHGRDSNPSVPARSREPKHHQAPYPIRVASVPLRARNRARKWLCSDRPQIRQFVFYRRYRTKLSCAFRPDAIPQPGGHSIPRFLLSSGRCTSRRNQAAGGHAVAL